MPVMEIPSIISEPIESFSLLKRQKKHLKEYLMGLIVSQKTTISSMNRMFIDGNDQSSLNKFVTQSKWNSMDMNDKRLGLLQTNNKTKYKPWGIIAIDDTLCHKTGKDIEGVDYHFDHSEKKHVMGHNIVTSNYADKETDYPINLKVYHREHSDIANKEGFKTKIELAIELIHDVMSRNIPANAFTFDSWFLCKNMADVIKGYKKAYVARAKSNRVIWIKDVKWSISDFAKSIPAKKFKVIEIKGKSYMAYSLTCKMSKLGKVRICICREKDDDKNLFYLVTNMLDWEERKILETYGMRWNIECFYKDAKQELGFESYQMRKLEGIMKHWYLVFLAYSLLRLAVANGRLGKWLNAETIGKACRDVGIGCVESLLRWAYENYKENIGLEDLMEEIKMKIAKL